MSITLTNTRELSKQPGRVLRHLARQGPQIITQNGKPAAYLMPASPLGIESDLEVIRALRLKQALRAVQSEAAKAGASNLSSEEIEREVDQTRLERKRKATRR